MVNGPSVIELSFKFQTSLGPFEGAGACRSGISMVVQKESRTCETALFLTFLSLLFAGFDLFADDMTLMGL